MTDNTIDRETMLILLGGEWPEARGFDWDTVFEFKLEEDGVWEPYNEEGEMLSGPGLRVKAGIGQEFSKLLDESEIPDCPTCNDTGRYDVANMGDGQWAGRVCNCKAGQDFAQTLG